jgi:hypothetical protein
MRVSDGAQKINRQGGAIFIHEEDPFTVRVADVSQSPLAPLKVRDFVYERLIRISPATLYRGALIAGEKGLLARGLGEERLDDYGALPAEWRERERIARRLFRETTDHLRIADSLCGVPGFWEDNRGSHLWKERDYIAPRLLIPVRDGSGRIQAFQIRLPYAAR